MGQALILHPDYSCAAVDGIGVEAARAPGGVLVLHYALRGRLDGLRLPVPQSPGRRDGLWRHSCFEAFLRIGAGTAGYREFNFAPSGDWAAYRFDGYRLGMRDLDGSEMAAPRLSVETGDGGLTLRAELDLGRLADLGAEAGWRLGLAAVIETADGDLSYWALAHPPGKPDFHHPDGCALDLPGAAEAAAQVRP